MTRFKISDSDSDSKTKFFDSGSDSCTFGFSWFRFRFRFQQKTDWFRNRFRFRNRNRASLTQKSAISTLALKPSVSPPYYPWVTATGGGHYFKKTCLNYLYTVHNWCKIRWFYPIICPTFCPKCPTFYPLPCPTFLLSGHQKSVDALNNLCLCM